MRSSGAGATLCGGATLGVRGSKIYWLRATTARAPPPCPRTSTAQRRLTGRQVSQQSPALSREEAWEEGPLRRPREVGRSRGRAWPFGWQTPQGSKREKRARNRCRKQYNDTKVMQNAANRN